MTLPPALKRVRRAVLDTMLLIYVLEDHPHLGTVSEWLLQQAAEGHYAGLITPISMAEVLVKPLQAGRPDLADRYRTALRNLPGVDLCDLTWQAGAMAGALRAKYSLPLPDMLQVAIAIEHDAVLITNDKALRAVDATDVVLLAELG